MIREKLVNGMLARGISCLLVDGPGQGRNLIRDESHMRPDWEHVVGPVVDYALTLPGVDTDRLVLAGWSFGLAVSVVGLLALLFTFGAVAANAYPLADDADTALLTALHLPIALWLVVGVAYVGGDWRSDRRRMDFIRFTGEWFIYFVLIALGGGVLTGFTVGTFSAIGIDAAVC